MSYTRADLNAAGSHYDACVYAAQKYGFTPELTALIATAEETFKTIEANFEDPAWDAWIAARAADQKEEAHHDT